MSCYAHPIQERRSSCRAEQMDASASSSHPLYIFFLQNHIPSLSLAGYMLLSVTRGEGEEWKWHPARDDTSPALPLSLGCQLGVKHLLLVGATKAIYNTHLFGYLWKKKRWGEKRKKPKRMNQGSPTTVSTSRFPQLLLTSRKFSNTKTL